MAADPTRLLLVDEAVRKRCFAAAQAWPIGSANSMEWSLVSGATNPQCVAKGKSSARTYVRGAGLDGPRPAA
jgi:hypothetical protein